MTPSEKQIDCLRFGQRLRRIEIDAGRTSLYHIARKRLIPRFPNFVGTLVIRALFLEGMEFSDHGVRECLPRGTGPASASITSVRIYADRQRLGAPAQNCVVALGQRDRTRHIDRSAGDREVGERAPCPLGQEMSIVDLDLRLSGKRLQIDLLSGWRSRIELSRDPRRKVTKPANLPITGKQKGG